MQVTTSSRTFVKDAMALNELVPLKNILTLQAAIFVGSPVIKELLSPDVKRIYQEVFSWKQPDLTIQRLRVRENKFPETSD